MVRATSNETLTEYGEAPRVTEWYLKERGARQWGHFQQDEHFVRCLQQGTAPSITPEDGRRAMEIALKFTV